jgi:hypothetical protein
MLPRRVGGVRAGSSGLVFAPGHVGQRLLQQPAAGSQRVRRAYAPGERYLAHTLALSQLYVDLIRATRWELAELLAFDPEPACWQHYSSPYGARFTLKPDAYLRLGVGDYELSWFIETDMASETSATIAGKARRYEALSAWQPGLGRPKTRRKGRKAQGKPCSPFVRPCAVPVHRRTPGQ